jgi:hypothetical protein
MRINVPHRLSDLHAASLVRRHVMLFGDPIRGRAEVKVDTLPRHGCLFIGGTTRQRQAPTVLSALAWYGCDGAPEQEYVVNQVAAPQIPAMRGSDYRFLKAFADHGLFMSAEVTAT